MQFCAFFSQVPVPLAVGQQVVESWPESAGFRTATRLDLSNLDSDAQDQD